MGGSRRFTGTLELDGVIVSYSVVRRRVRRSRLEVRAGELVVVLPRSAPEGTELEILRRHRSWVLSRLRLHMRAIELSRSLELVDRGREGLRSLVEGIVEGDRELGRRVRAVRIRRMRSSWGLYDSNGVITVNEALRYLPEELVRYVVYHEMTHSVVMRHNSEFWRILKSRLGDRDREELDMELRAYWFLLRDRGLLARARSVRRDVE
ncbi:MAG: M48 family metallopeptidase [Conexivisphaera sp.]